MPEKFPFPNENEIPPNLPALLRSLLLSSKTLLERFTEFGPPEREIIVALFTRLSNDEDGVIKNDYDRLTTVMDQVKNPKSSQSAKAARA